MWWWLGGYAVGAIVTGYVVARWMVEYDEKDDPGLVAILAQVWPFILLAGAIWLFGKSMLWLARAGRR